MLVDRRQPAVHAAARALLIEQVQALQALQRARCAVNCWSLRPQLQPRAQRPQNAGCQKQLRTRLEKLNSLSHLLHRREPVPEAIRVSCACCCQLRWWWWCLQWPTRLENRLSRWQLQSQSQRKRQKGQAHHSDCQSR